MLASPIFNMILKTCKHLNFDALIPLINAYFNIPENKFTILLNREKLGKKLTMNIAKEMKNKNRLVLDKKLRTVTVMSPLGKPFIACHF